MPLLQYKCPCCKKQFEELVKRHDEEVKCPDCGSAALRDYSGKVYSATGMPAKRCSGNCKNCSGC